MARSEKFTIGWLARQTHCLVQTVRYYEQIGLMPRPERSPGNQRLYGQADLKRLAFIRHSRELGFPLEAVRTLLGLAQDLGQSCDAVDSLARAQLHQVKSRIERLRALESELERMIRQCAGGGIDGCRVIEVLADHSLCQHADHTTPA